MPLLYTGQEVSVRKRLRFFEKDTVDWSGESLAPFYRSLFELKHLHQSLANGVAGGQQATLRTDAGDRVYAFARSRAGDVVLVALNFGDAPVTATYYELGTPGSYVDWFSHAPLTLPASGTIDIPAHGYRVLVH
jgi:glycosidase